MSEPLDNAPWHALTTRHAGFAEVAGGARRYLPDVSVFAAAEALDADGWADLNTLVGPDGMVVLFQPEIPDPPAAWTVQVRGVGLQMVLTGALRAVPLPEAEVVALTDDDVPAMLDLVALTRPGPFLSRTIELGGYVGVKADGRLMAMAGHRLNLAGFTEISAVCTHPDVQGQGMAALLVTHVVDVIQGRGDTAFLHLAADNHTAQRVYERLGFVVRRPVDILVARPPR